MLPNTFFARITERTRVPGSDRITERRRADRYPLDVDVALYATASDAVGGRAGVRLTELSTTGLKIEVAVGAPEIHGLCIVAIGDDTRTSEASAVLLCDARYHLTTRSGSVEIGARIVAILAPGHTLAPGQPLGTCRWIPCAEVTPTDPLRPAHNAA